MKKKNKIINLGVTFFSLLIIIITLPKFIVDMNISTNYFFKSIFIIFNKDMPMYIKLKFILYIMSDLVFIVVTSSLIFLGRKRILGGVMRIKKEYIEYLKACNFNKRDRLRQIKIVQRRDKVISSKELYDETEYGKIYKKILKKYKKSNINIERARIKQYFIGDRKKKEDANTLMAISTSAILGSFLGALLSGKFDDISVLAFFLIWVLGASILVIFLNIFIKRSSKETYGKDLYYNLVLEALDQIEKENEMKEKDSKNDKTTIEGFKS